MSTRSLDRFFVCGCALFIGTMCLAGQTSWTNPNGGNWTDASNWSSGVPSVGDAAILSPLDSDGYTIFVAPNLAIAELRVGAPRGGGTIVLQGGSLSVSGLTRVGSAGDVGTLRLSDCALQSSVIDIGKTGGDGTIEMRDTAAMTSSALTCGIDGTGALDLATMTSTLCATLTLGAGSTLTLQAQPVSPALLVTGSIVRNGVLNVTMTPLFAWPIPNVLLAKVVGGGATGAFATVNEPTFDGYVVPVQQANSFTIVKIAQYDPVLALETVIQQTPVYVGFAHYLKGYLHHISGWMQHVYPSWETDNPAHAIGDSSGLYVLTDDPIVLTAHVTHNGVEYTGSMNITPSTDYPYVYECISTAADGTPANGWSTGWVSFSKDARFVLFGSDATNLVTPAPDVMHRHVYIKDRQTGDVEQIDVDGAWWDGLHAIYSECMSDDARFVAFYGALASAPDVEQVWLRDRWTKTTKAISIAPDGTLGDKRSDFPFVVADGSAVLFQTWATNIVPGAPGTYRVIVRHDIATGINTLASVASNGEPANGDSMEPIASEDGSIIAFTTTATNLVADNAGTLRLVLRDSSSTTWERIDLTASGAGSNEGGFAYAMTPDGSRVLFHSASSNFDAPPDANSLDVFVRDRIAGTTTWLSPDLGLSAYTSYAGHSISDDGTYALIGAQEGGLRRVTIATGAIDGTAIDPWGAPVNWIDGGALSADGKCAVFSSSTLGLVPFGSVFERQTYVRVFGPFNAADFNHDGFVNSVDLATLLSAWSGSGIGDVDGDGIVGPGDLAALLGAWTTT